MDASVDLGSQLAALADAIAQLPFAEQRRRLLSLLQQLDKRSGGSDEYVALLLQLETDIRQRVALRQW